MNAFKTDAITGLPSLDNYNQNPVTIDVGQADFVPCVGTLDPRLDWTVERRGIPCYDWALHGTTTWQRDAVYSGPYSPKKNITLKSQQGTYTDNSFWNTPSGITAINVNLIRFADVILWLAECDIETGNLKESRTYVNLVRARAGKAANIFYKYNNDADPSQGNSTTPAANYKVGLYITPWTDAATARKAVHYERRIELGMERSRFFDLVIWGEAKTTLNAYIQYESTLRTFMQGATFPNNGNYYPISQRQIDLNPKLVQNP